MPKTTTPGLLPFALRLRALRARRGVTQRDIADAAGVARGTVGFLEQARCCPTADNLARLADVFGVSMDELWRGVGRCEGIGVLRDEGRGP